MTKTKGLLFTAGIVLAMVFTFSCSSGDDDGGGSSPSGGNPSSSSSGESGPITKSKISGVSQKGPFVEGSTATLYELNDDFAQTGRTFREIIADDKGTFEIRGVELISPYARLEASGFYRNEVTGEISSAPIALFAIADIREKDNVNVNLLTHLEYNRVLNLVDGGKSVAEAKKQAQKEILSVFGINGDDFANSEDMSIFGTTEGDAALLAISVLLQGNLSEGEFSQRLTNLSQAIKNDGTWSNEAEKNKITEWASALLEKEKISKTSEIKSKILGWGLSPVVPDFEKYVRVYWNYAYGLGSCGSANEREVKKDNGNTYRICKSGNWTVATEFEYDTYQWGNCTDANMGEVKTGNITGIEYVCKYGSWKISNYKDKYCSRKACEYFTDSRDGQRYAYVEINGQIWMAENLNYEAESSRCYGEGGPVVNERDDDGEPINPITLSPSEVQANCDEYGRLYNWATAKMVCPSGWHLPTQAEWEVMTTSIGGDATEGKKLKATSGWNDKDDGSSGNGMDDYYGFSALPGGLGSLDGSFGSIGRVGGWWSAREGSVDGAYSRGMYYDRETAQWNYDGKSYLFSVRCVKDAP